MMVIFESLLVDTDVLNKSLRGDKTKQINLKYGKDKYGIPLFTVCKLINGSNNMKQRGEFMKVLRYYNLPLVDEKVSEQAFSLYKKYSQKNDVKISDSLIAATAIVNDRPLRNENKKDFNFIEKINFYKEK